MLYFGGPMEFSERRLQVFVMRSRQDPKEERRKERKRQWVGRFERAKQRRHLNNAPSLLASRIGRWEKPGIRSVEEQCERPGRDRDRAASGLLGPVDIQHRWIEGRGDAETWCKRARALVAVEGGGGGGAKLLGWVTAQGMLSPGWDGWV